MYNKNNICVKFKKGKCLATFTVKIKIVILLLSKFVEMFRTFTTNKTEKKYKHNMYTN